MKPLSILLAAVMASLCFGADEPAKEKDKKVYLCVYDLEHDKTQAPHAHTPAILEHLQKGETVYVYDEQSVSVMRLEDGIVRALASVESPEDDQEQILGLVYTQLGKSAAEDVQFIFVGAITKLADENPEYVWGLAGVGLHTIENLPPGYAAEGFVLATMKLMLKSVDDFGLRRDWKDLLARMNSCKEKAKEADAKRARESAEAKARLTQKQRELTRTALLILKDAETQVQSEKAREENNAEPERAPPPQEQEK